MLPVNLLYSHDRHIPHDNSPQHNWPHFGKAFIDCSTQFLAILSFPRSSMTASTVHAVYKMWASPPRVTQNQVTQFKAIKVN